MAKAARRTATAFPIVGIGASAGGLEAYSALLEHLARDTGMGFVLVQHLDPEHESALTNLLSRKTKLPVIEVTQNLRIKPDNVYVIPPNTQLSIERGVLKLVPRGKSRVPHHPINFFFESLAADQRERAIGVVLSGTGTDGTLGLEAIKAEGGITFAQDDTAKYDSMPRSAVAAGCADFVLSAQKIAQELARIAHHPYVKQMGDGDAAEQGSPEDDRAQATLHSEDSKSLPSGGHGSPHTDSKKARAEGEEAATPGDQGYKKILLLLRTHSGVDFSLYKSTTIQRRINRRILLTKHTGLADYGNFLRGNAKELDALYSDVLISVTSFFRNPEAFDVLQRKVFPALLKQHSDQPLRTWVLGCSTGQEAYSIAMSFTESSDKLPRARKLQIFATDLNEALLDKARHGLYAKTLEQDISPERLRRFFVEEQGGYRIIKPLREMVVFARQNMVADPPFSRMDLISCRNLLIYLEPSLQKKALPTFHYALKPGGFLFLGASESVSGFTDLFEPLDKKHKIFSKKVAPAVGFHLPARKERVSTNPPPGALRASALPRKGGGKSAGAPPEVPDGFRSELSAQREADRVTVNQFAPPSVLINDELQVLQFRGPTGGFLQPPAGKASFDLLKMAREGLMLPLRAAINQARKQNKAVRRDNIRVNGSDKKVSVEVIPLKNLRERCFLVLFEDAKATGKSARLVPHPGPLPVQRGEGVTRRRIAELESELGETRDFVQSMQEQHEAANEELQASSEEVQSANEELQSVNEELETSKEELESANEELTTVNEEMANRNTELGRLNSDLVNLQTSTHQAIVLLARDLTIRRFSVQAEKQFNLHAADLGRPIGNVRHNLVLPELEDLISKVIADVRETEREIQDTAGRWYSLRLRPYLSLDNKVDGAVLVLVDIDALKQSDQVIAAERDFAEAIVRTAHDPLLILNADLRVHSANEAFYSTFKISREEAIGRLVYDLGNRQWNIPKLRELLEDILPQKSVFDDFEVTHDFESIGTRSMLLNARRVNAAAGQPFRILLGIQDFTERKHSEEILIDVAKGKDEFLAVLAHELRGPLAPLSNALQIIQRDDGVSETVKQARDLAARQVQHMVRLIDDLLDTSRISRGKFTLRQTQVELASVMYQSLETCRPAIDSARHELTVAMPPEPVYLRADAVRLAQIFSNLLTNACKYTEPGGRIGFSAVREGGEVVITISDNGIGLAAETLPHVFEMFSQVDQGLARSQGGLGIGLSLVQLLVELHGGHVTASSAGLGQGSTFVVRLPVLAQVTEAVQPAPVAAAAEIARRILVVDDNRDSATTLALWLDLSGHKTQTAHDGLEALSAAESFRPEVVLLDIGLPELDGYEVARRIRSADWGKSMRLVALTGWGQAEDRRKSKDAGFDSHLVKPVDTVMLSKLLADMTTWGGGGDWSEVDGNLS